jgi:hypothetical protein
MDSPVALTVQQLVATLGGYTFIVGGLAGLLGRIWVLRIVEREKFALQRQLDQTNRTLQAELDQRLHVTKSQFDTEFANYKEIWSCLVDFRIKALRIRPILDYVDPKETREERLKKRLQEFSPAFGALRDLVEKNKPFYSASVCDRLQNVIKRCYEESVAAENHERSHSEYWKEAKANCEAITAAVDETCEEIRSRISSIILTS